ncbi:Ion channel family protein [Giardia muris]|uniref:Ion channel family protein n=1 Tax=Giardia muris TaxID=5742 RepID=A0A4Z1SN48_GIAMU|nr:Ion channel family protein [Giardia muris]|eukprot:TNJ27164.1 Ion channel family protein [Giardia muris]
MKPRYYAHVRDFDFRLPETIFDKDVPSLFFLIVNLLDFIAFYILVSYRPTWPITAFFWLPIQVIIICDIINFTIQCVRYKIHFFSWAYLFWILSPISSLVSILVVTLVQRRPWQEMYYYHLGSFSIYRGLIPSLGPIYRLSTSHTRWLKGYYIPDFIKSSVRVAYKVFAFIMCYVGLFQVFNQYYTEEPTGLIDTVYYTMATIGSIGYGDIIPETPLTRLLLCFYTLAFLGSMPSFISESIAELRQAYALHKLRTACKHGITVIADQTISFMYLQRLIIPSNVNIGFINLNPDDNQKLIRACSSFRNMGYINLHNCGVDGHERMMDYEFLINCLINKSRKIVILPPTSETNKVDGKCLAIGLNCARVMRDRSELIMMTRETGRSNAIQEYLGTYHDRCSVICITEFTTQILMLTCFFPGFATFFFNILLPPHVNLHKLENRTAESFNDRLHTVRLRASLLLAKRRATTTELRKQKRRTTTKRYDIYSQHLPLEAQTFDTLRKTVALRTSAISMALKDLDPKRSTVNYSSTRNWNELTPIRSDAAQVPLRLDTGSNPTSDRSTLSINQELRVSKQAVNEAVDALIGRIRRFPTVDAIMRLRDSLRLDLRPGIYYENQRKAKHCYETNKRIHLLLPKMEWCPMMVAQAQDQPIIRRSISVRQMNDYLGMFSIQQPEIDHKLASVLKSRSANSYKEDCLDYESIYVAKKTFSASLCGFLLCRNNADEVSIDRRQPAQLRQKPVYFPYNKETGQAQGLIGSPSFEKSMSAENLCKIPSSFLGDNTTDGSTVESTRRSLYGLFLPLGLQNNVFRSDSVAKPTLHAILDPTYMHEEVVRTIMNHELHLNPVPQFSLDLHQVTTLGIVLLNPIDEKLFTSLLFSLLKEKGLKKIILGLDSFTKEMHQQYCGVVRNVTFCIERSEDEADHGPLISDIAHDRSTTDAQAFGTSGMTTLYLRGQKNERFLKSDTTENIRVRAGRDQELTIEIYALDSTVADEINLTGLQNVDRTLIINPDDNSSANEGHVLLTKYAFESVGQTNLLIYSTDLYNTLMLHDLSFGDDYRQGRFIPNVEGALTASFIYYSENALMSLSLLNKIFAHRHAFFVYRVCFEGEQPTIIAATDGSADAQSQGKQRQYKIDDNILTVDGLERFLGMCHLEVLYYLISDCLLLVPDPTLLLRDNDIVVCYPEELFKP